MSSEIREQWDRLFGLRDDQQECIERGIDTNAGLIQTEIDALADELEQWARTAEAGETLDWVCAQWMRDRPHVQWFATNNGGESGCFFDDVRYVVEGWLERTQARGYYLDHEICSVEHWRGYSEHDKGAAMELLESMATLQTTLWLGRTRWKLQVALGNGASEVIGCAENPRLAIARSAAVLCARGIDVQGGSTE